MEQGSSYLAMEIAAWIHGCAPVRPRPQCNACRNARPGGFGALAPGDTLAARPTEATAAAMSGFVDAEIWKVSVCDSYILGYCLGR